MKATWEKTESNKGILAVETDVEEVERALNHAFGKVVKSVSVPGFRKGKVPRNVFEKRFGVESLYQDALDVLLPEAYKQALKDTEIEPVDTPDIEVEQFAKGEPCLFKATVTVKPEVLLGEYKGLEVDLNDYSVTDEDVAKELATMQERQAELFVVEDGELQNADHAIIDFEGFKDGVPFPGGKGSRYTLEIGSGTFIPGFEEQLIGMKKEEEREIPVTFPEEYHAEDLAGQPVTFKVVLHEIKRKNLPALDDEFAKDVSEFETLEELKNDIKNKLEEKSQQKAKEELQDKLLEKAAENATIDIPQVMIDHENDRMLQEFEQSLVYQGLTLQMYYQFSGLNEESLREQFMKDAEKRVRISLTLEAIANAENIEVSTEEAEEEVKRLAEIYKQDPKDMLKIIKSQQGIAGLKKDMKIQKAIELLIASSKTAA